MDDVYETYRNAMNEFVAIELPTEQDIMNFIRKMRWCASKAERMSDKQTYLVIADKWEQKLARMEK